MVTGGFTKEEEKKAFLQEHENVVEVLVYLINLSWVADILWLWYSLMAILNCWH